MRVISPIDITDARLTSDTVPETAPSVWSGATNYALGDRASIAGGAAGLITVYESIQNANLNNLTSDVTWWKNAGTTYPVWSSIVSYNIGDYVIDSVNHIMYKSAASGANLNHAVTDVLWWTNYSPTNRWNMFDSLRGTKTISPINIITVITPGVRFDSLAVLAAVGTSISVSITSGATVIYTYSETLSHRDVASWYQYFFTPFVYKKNIILFNIPPFSNSVVTITISGTNVECGSILLGMNEYIGKTQYSPKSNLINFSTITRHIDGSPNDVIQRRSIPQIDASLFLEHDQVDRVRGVRENLNAVPALWFGLDDITSQYYDTLVILGIYRGFEIDLTYPEAAIVTLKLEEI